MAAFDDENLTLCFPRHSSGQDPQKPIVVRTPQPALLPPNHILLKVDRFGFSANNITYQALGEATHFRYFDFHSAPEVGDVSSKTHGLVPVWGFGTVTISTHPRILRGERVYGYLAPTRYLVIPVSSSDVNKHAFYVHRPHLPADRRPYNQILRCAADPQYDTSPEAEDLTMLYRPLFWTSYWCEDWIFKSDYRGANSILISSASSKTAFCLAYLIGKRSARHEIPRKKIVGLTSKRNLAFTAGLGLYDEVVDYESFTTAPCLRLADDERWIYVDVAGNDALNGRVFAHFGSNKRLVASIALGMTNISPSAPDASSEKWRLNTFTDIPRSTSSTAPAPLEHFFMVEWLNVRKHSLTPQQIHSSQNKAWKDLMKDCVRWVKLDRVAGAKNVKKAYDRVVKGGLEPDRGFIWSLWEDDGKTNIRSKL